MKKRVKQVMIIVLLLLIVLALTIGVYIWMNKSDGLDIDEDAKKYQANIQRPEDWGNSRIAIPGYGDMQMKENSDILHVALYNPSDNPCYFVFSVIMEGRELYKSKLVPPGEAITKIKLSKQVGPGIHTVVIKIDTYDLADKKTPMNGSQVQTRIITYSN